MLNQYFRILWLLDFIDNKDVVKDVRAIQLKWSHAGPSLPDFNNINAASCIQLTSPFASILMKLKLNIKDFIFQIKKTLIHFLSHLRETRILLVEKRLKMTHTLNEEMKWTETSKNTHKEGHAWVEELWPKYRTCTELLMKLLS